MRSNLILRTSKVPGTDLALSAELAWTPKYRFSMSTLNWPKFRPSLG